MAPPSGVDARSLCNAPDPVCASQNIVYRISSFDPAASAVRIKKDLLVSNRHVVADNKLVKILLTSGEAISGEVIPSSYEGDLVLIRANLGNGPVAILSDDLAGNLLTIGHDQKNREIQVYRPGRLLIKPDANVQFSRIHHTAHSQPGNSGGALVNDKGQVVGITTSGGNGRSEAIPASHISKLIDMSGVQYAEFDKKLAASYRNCILKTEKYQNVRRLDDEDAIALITACSSTKNRQLLAQTAMILGRANRLQKSAEMFEKSLARDPSAINARLGYLVTLHLAKRYQDEVGILTSLMALIPRDVMVQRFAIQVGKHLNDPKLIDAGLAIIEQYAPERLAAAKRFLSAKGRTLRN